MPSPRIYDHARPADVDYPAEIYRVVGTSDTAVTLLRVADAEGRRIHTGELITVSDDEFDGFEPAQNPDGEPSIPGRTRTLYTVSCCGDDLPGEAGVPNGSFGQAITMSAAGITQTMDRLTGSAIVSATAKMGIEKLARAELKMSQRG